MTHSAIEVRVQNSEATRHSRPKIKVLSDPNPLHNHGARLSSANRDIGPNRASQSSPGYDLARHAET